MFYVYEWYRADLNLPYYIGKGKGKRAYDLKRNKHADIVTRYLAKNGIRRDVRIIAYFQTEEAAFDFEIERIVFWGYLKEFDILTNQTLGGEGFTGGRHTEKTRKIMSEKQKIIQNQPAMLEFNRKRMLGNPSRTGMKDTEETRLKKKISVKISKNFPKSIEKAREASLKMHSNPKFKEKHREACKIAANRSKNITRLRNQTGSKHPAAKPVADLTNMLLFGSLTEASVFYRLNNIQAVCVGKQKTSGGKVFAYVSSLSDEVRSQLKKAGDKNGL